MEVTITTTDTLSSGDATMVSTKPGTLTKELFLGQDNHFKMVEDSKSDQEWLEVKLSSGTSTLVTTNTDSESITLSHGTKDNGGSLIEEQELSDQS
jgi:hypothetical protein